MQAITIPLTFLLIIIYMYRIWRKNPTVILLGAVFFIEMIWQLISIVWIEGGAYISEELRYSYFTGASIRFFLLILPFALLYPYFLNKELKENDNCYFKKKISGIKHLSERDIFIITMLLIMYSLIDILISGNIPLFTRMWYYVKI